MGGKKQLQVTVINQEGVLFYGDADVVFVPGERDIVAVMPFHTPMIMKLGEGKVVVRTGRSMNQVANTKSGLLYVGDNEVSVLVNQ